MKNRVDSHSITTHSDTYFSFLAKSSRVKQSEEELENQVKGHLGILFGIANLAKHSHKA